MYPLVCICIDKNFLPQWYLPLHTFPPKNIDFLIEREMKNDHNIYLKKSKIIRLLISLRDIHAKRLWYVSPVRM